jgi:hypothetical protein
MELAALQSLTKYPASRSIGFSAPALNTPFAALQRSSLDTVPRTLARPSSSSHELHFPYRVRSCLSPPSASARHLPWDSFPLRDLNSQSPLFIGLPSSQLCFVHSVSHTFDDLLLYESCGLISSHYRVRDSLFRGFPRCQAASLHQRTVPSCRW